MTRPALISFEQVVQAAESLRDQGQKPNTRNIRLALGKGSQATILKFLQQWQETQIKNPSTDNITDPAITRAINNCLLINIQNTTSEKKSI